MSMIEIRKLGKIYKTKHGVITKALKDINLSFGKSGMVFLHGKSGSGKTTLLNIIGGLDSPTTGELIAYGRSSLRFSASDFDSYRNTCVGFIFQEYNIIDDFTVAENIAIALELQGKPKDKAAIDELLAKVDMGGYAARRTNTLSGGQKQRLAIARALIKNPDTILADEPSGALDSETGAQIFDLLKKLSETKLVIVVSHDTNFAKRYADRIIELKDGEIIKDYHNDGWQPVVKSSKIFINPDQLNIKNGAAVNDSEIEQIVGFIKNHGGELVITRKAPAQVESIENPLIVREEKPIPTAAEEVFKKSVENNVPENSGTPKVFIKSKLPMKYAVKIGASGLKLKPFRLVVTILLTTVSLIIFGLLSTMMAYNERNIMARALKDSDYSAIVLSKSYNLYNNKNGTVASRRTYFTDEDIVELENKYSVLNFLGTYTFNNLTYKSVLGMNPLQAYYATGTSFDGFAELSELTLSKYGLELIFGEYPINDNDIAISKYMYETYVSAGYLENGSTIVINNYADIYGKEVSFEGKSGTVSFIIKGIIDCGDMPSDFNALKNVTSVMNDTELNELSAKFQDALSSSLHKLLFVKEGFYDYAKQNLVSNRNDDTVEVFKSINITGEYIIHDAENPYYGSIDKIARFSDNTDYDIRFFDSGGAELQNNEIVLSIQDFCALSDLYGRYKLYEMNYSDLDSYNNAVTELINNFEGLSEELVTEYLNEMIKGFIAFGDIFLTMQENGSSLIVKGIFIGTDFYADQGNCFVSDSFYDSYAADNKDIGYTTKYVEPDNAIFNYLYVPFGSADEQINQLLNITEMVNQDNDTFMAINNSIADEVLTINEIVSDLSMIFLIGGLATALFAALLLFNFISFSISNKQHEIGILRSMGAKKFDIIKIFYFETSFIALLCFIFAVIGSLIVCTIINSYLIGSRLLNVSIFLFGGLQVMFILAIAFIITTLATILPILLYTKRKPIDIIRKV